MNAPYRQTLTDRELRWLRHVAVHGPQSSKFLLEVCVDTHRCRDTGLRRLQRLRETNFLRRPSQQDEIAKADFNPNVYDLTKQSERYLKGIGDPEHIRPAGHWWHAFHTACITSAIAIEATKRDYRYIPAHQILARNSATLAIPTGQKKLIPDQLFAIDYGGSFRSFVLEVDRGTEPIRSQTARKSLRRMIDTYADLAAKDALRRHYSLKSPLLILMAFTNPLRAAHCLELVQSRPDAFARIVLVCSIPSGFPRWEQLRAAIAAPWMRTSHPPFDLLL